MAEPEKPFIDGHSNFQNFDAFLELGGNIVTGKQIGRAHV